MKFLKNDEAVSPVIGVILMVAITVILAAVIAAFVFGMSGSVQKTRNVAVTAAQVADNVTVTYQGGPDDATVQYLKISVGNGAPWYSDMSVADIKVAAAVNADLTKAKPTVGARMVIDGEGSPAQDNVVVVAHFADGTEQVVLDTNV